MDNSKNSSNTSKVEKVQLPLKGFIAKMESDKPNWERWIEGMGDGRFRIHAKKKR